MPRYAILAHDHPQLHWDFLLEGEMTLRTWRLESPPEPGMVIRAEALPDHRLAYLDYEGPVSANRGIVRRWDAGLFKYVTNDPGEVVVKLVGARLKGRALLKRGTEWEFVFWPDAAPDAAPEFRHPAGSRSSLQ